MSAVEALIVGRSGCGDGATANPVAGAFVGDGKPPASGARGVTGGIAAVDDRAGAGDGDDAGPAPKAASSAITVESPTTSTSFDWEHFGSVSEISSARKL